MKLKRLFQPKEKPERGIYEAIVAAARQEKFYRDMGVADTVEGRFEMLVLHVFLVLNRLKGGGVEDFRQNLTNLFFDDMDGELRELGVSDISVGKKVRKIAESYYGRVLAYEKALSTTSQLASALERNVYPEGVTETHLESLAAYVVDAVQKLSALPVITIMRGDVRFS